MEPEVVMTMEADTAHRFWLGKVNVTVALARGQMKAKGPVAKILKLVPLTKPVFPRYRALLEQDGTAGPARGRLMAAGGAGPRPAEGVQGLLPVHRHDPGDLRARPARLDGLRIPEGGRAAGLRRHRQGDPRHGPRRARRGGRRDGGLEVAGVFDEVPAGLLDDVVERAPPPPRRPAPTRSSRSAADR